MIRPGFLIRDSNRGNATTRNTSNRFNGLWRQGHDFKTVKTVGASALPVSPVIEIAG